MSRGLKRAEPTARSAHSAHPGEPRQLESLRGFAALLLIGFALFASAAQPPAIETAKIEYLIQSVQSLQGVEFFRNGAAYSGSAAAEHMRLKWRRAGNRVASAEDFIRDCASVSSVSGLPYTLRYADGRVTTVAEFLSRKLAQYPIATP